MVVKIVLWALVIVFGLLWLSRRAANRKSHRP